MRKETNTKVRYYTYKNGVLTEVNPPKTISQLTKEMNNAISVEDYESAIVLRDKIKTLTKK